jgi:general secretion pathway protein B
MSFILDALKKSESDRQRQSGPALFEVKVAPPKSRFPVWAIAIVALLVVNMIIVGWMLLRRASHGEDTTAAAPAVTTNNTPPPVAPPLSAGSPSAAPPSGTMAPTSAQPSNAPTDAQQQSRMGTPQARMPERDQNEPTLAGNTAPARDAAGTNTDATANPDDYAPAAEPGSSLFKGHVKRGTDSGLMLYQDAALVQGSNLPQLRLDLHVYAVKPQERFALINMHKMHEGDSLQDGVRVEAITPDGVVLSHNGSKFLLPNE